MAANKSDLTTKLSKKVAELTVVVHMLFKRNHEKEVEFEYFKVLTEKEIENVKQKFQSRVEWLEGQLEEQETYRVKVEYKLGDMKELEEKVLMLNRRHEETMEQLKAKGELLGIANLENDVLKQKIKSYEEDLENLRPNENERTKSATHLQNHAENSTVESNEKIDQLEKKLAQLNIDYETERTKSYAEKVALQNKIDNYNSSLSQEIEELKETLNLLSNKQASDQKKLSEIEKEKKKLGDDLKKALGEKKSLENVATKLKEQFKRAMKNQFMQNDVHHTFREPQRSPPKTALFETVRTESLPYFISLVLVLK